MGDMSKSTGITIAIIVFGLIALLSTCGYNRIDAGHAGIVVELFGNEKGVQNVALVNGGQFFNRWSEEIHEFPTFVQHTVWTATVNEGNPVNEEFAVTTADGMTLKFDVGFDYQVIPERVPHIFSKYRKDLPQITEEFLRTAVRNSYNEVGGRFISDTILFKRNIYEKEAKKVLVEKLKDDFIVTQLGIIGEIRVPPNMKAAIDAKVTTNQNAQTAENLVKQKTAEANQKIAIAKGDSAQMMIDVHAKANAIKVGADAESYSNYKISSSVTSTLIEWKKANSWNGELPTYVGGSSPIMQMPK